MQANHKIIDVTLLDALKEAEDGSFLKHAPQLTSKVLHPDTFEKMDAKKAEAVNLVVGFNCSILVKNLFFQLFSDRTVATMQMLEHCSEDHPLLIAISQVRKNEPIPSIRIGISNYVNFANAVRILYCPMTVISPHQWKRNKQPLQQPITAKNVDARLEVSHAMCTTFIPQSGQQCI